MDKLSPEERSWNMSRIRSKGMKPEMLVRSLAHRMGYRFRLHAPDLPGRPDLVFRSRKKIVFVHGCFWHGHSCKEGMRVPKSNVSYWTEKVARNKARDEKNAHLLVKSGWGLLTIWECQSEDIVRKKLSEFLSA